VVELPLVPGREFNLIGWEQGGIALGHFIGRVWVRKGGPQDKWLVPVFLQKSNGLAGDQTGGIICQRKV
jgi:hypothetical protein